MPEPNYEDHDKLIRLEVEMEQLRRSEEQNRMMLLEQIADLRLQVKNNRADIESLKTDRARFIAISGTISVVSGALSRFFWK